MDTREVLVVTPTADSGSVDVQYEVSSTELYCCAWLVCRVGGRAV